MLKEQGSSLIRVIAEPGKLSAFWAPGPEKIKTKAKTGLAGMGIPEGNAQPGAAAGNRGDRKPGAAEKPLEGAATSNAVAAQPVECRLELPLHQGDERLAARLTEYLQDKPMELAALLAGGACPPELAALLPAQPLWDLAAAADPSPPETSAAGLQAAAPQRKRSGTAEAALPQDGGKAAGQAAAGQAAAGQAAAGHSRLGPAGGWRCACGDPACRRAPELLRAAEARWAADPLLRLAAFGLPPEELARAVFAVWAADGADEGEDAGQEAAGAAEPADPQAETPPPRPRTGPSVAEWLAAAAAHGRLHEPGPQLREWRSLAPRGGEGPAAASVLAAADPGLGASGVSPGVKAALAEMLPGVPGAGPGLEWIAERAAEQARKQLADEERKS